METAALSCQRSPMTLFYPISLPQVQTRVDVHLLLAEKCGRKYHKSPFHRDFFVTVLSVPLVRVVIIKTLALLFLATYAA